MASLDSELFDRLSLCALKDNPKLVVDDFAAIVQATRFLLREQDFSLHAAFSHASALRLLHDGGVFVNEHEGLRSRLPHIARLESSLLENARVPRETLQLQALQWLKRQKDLPKFLDGIDEIVCDRAIDLCETKLRLIFRLAELGQAFKFPLPLDFKARGLMPPVQALLSQLENQGAGLPISIELDEISVAKPLEPFFNSIFDDVNYSFEDEAVLSSVCAVLMSQFSSQVRWVCEQIAQLKEKSDHPVSIAIAFRSLDLRMRCFEEELAQHNLPYKVSANLALAELAEVKILLRKLRERLGRETANSKGTMSGFLDDAINLVTLPEVISLLGHFARELSAETREVPLQDFCHWLELLLQRREVAFRSDSNAEVVELISVKQLHARKFDFVFLVDLSQGRFPKTDGSGSPFSDSDSHEINKIVGTRVLPVLYEDPLEPSILKTRLGFESMWFVDAMACAQKGLFLCSSSVDPSGREQAPSEFLNAAIKVVGQQRVEKVSPLNQIPLPPFSKGEQALYPQLDPNHSSEVFKRWLGLTSSHPLTPSRLEAFASCPFRALVERIFGIEDLERSNEDVDARKVGLFAHAVLEKFFRSHENASLVEGLTPKFRQHLSDIIQDHRYLLDGDAKASPGMVAANVLWLSLVLERAISNLLKSPPIADVEPFLFEQRLGFDEKMCKVRVQGTELFLGGILDRVDQGHDALCVVDYKMSSAMALRQKIAPKEIFQTHFQLPLYLRLLLDAYPETKEKNLFAYLVSIRDGVVSSVLGRDSLPDLKQLVTDDERDDGLASSIGRVMSPILKGQFPAKANASCDYCHLKSVCRIRRSELEPRDDA